MENKNKNKIRKKIAIKTINHQKIKIIKKNKLKMIK